MSCLALTKEGKPCKNHASAYYENCCYLKDHQLQVAEMKLQKLKEEKKEHYQSVLKNERIEVVEEAKKPFEELIKQNQDVIKKKEKENEELRAKNEDLWNEITELKTGIRLDRHTIDNVKWRIARMRYSKNRSEFTKREGEKFYKENEYCYYLSLVMHWEKLHNKYFGKIPKLGGDWPEEYSRTEGLEQQLSEVEDTLEIAVRKQDYERAAELRDELTLLKKSLEELISQVKHVKPTFSSYGDSLKRT